MPDEVVDAWLVERVESRGWPPMGPAWHALLRFYSPSQWQMFSWVKREIDLCQVNYSEKSSNIISGLADSCFRGSKNGYSNVENSAARMRRIYEHLTTTGRLPGAVVLISNSEWEIVDGSHRVSCYVACRNTPQLAGLVSVQQTAWVATAQRSNNSFNPMPLRGTG